MTGFFGIWAGRVKAAAVVPANAGTHSHECMCIATGDPYAVPRIDQAAAYGSLRSQGRRRSSALNLCQKPRQIIRDMIDIGRIPAFQLPVLAHHFLGAVGHDQHRGHAELVRHHEVAGEILEHRRFRGIHAVDAQEFVVGLRRRLRLQFGGDDVEHRLEMLGYAEPLQHRAGMVGRAVGQDQLAAGKFCDRSPHRRVRLQRRVIDLVHIGQIIVGVHAMLGHHAAHAGAVAAVIVLLDHAGFFRGDFQERADELADPRVDLLPQIDVVRVQRVVEIEHPGVDMA